MDRVIGKEDGFYDEKEGGNLQQVWLEDDKQWGKNRQEVSGDGLNELIE